MDVIVIREATAADAGPCASIYRPYVEDTTITFELEPPPADEMARRIAASHLWLVAERAGTVLGYAYAGPFKDRPAYRFTTEVSIYLDPAARGGGVGRRLYGALFERLAERGYRVACAAVTQPNPASAQLHSSLGFEPVGVFRRVGWKHGGWRDVAWYQRPLGEHACEQPDGEYDDGAAEPGVGEIPNRR